jgi:F-type H+-transporting ATPase subunit a
MTLGLAAIAMILWLVWSIQEVGVGGILHHIFGPKGGMTGIMGKVLVPVFFVIGILEVISIATRPVSLSLRLFGNIYAGENILGMMIGIGHEFHLPEVATAILSVIVPIPFYFLELMVGLLQAFVFMLLCAVYIQLSTSHEEEAH